EVLNVTTVDHSRNHELNRLLRYIPDLVSGLTNSVLTLFESIRHRLGDRVLQRVKHLIADEVPHRADTRLNPIPHVLNNSTQETELRGKVRVDPVHNRLENVLLDERPSNLNIVSDFRQQQLQDSLQELEPWNNLRVDPIQDRRENVLLNELPRRVNGNADTLPNHLNDGPEQLEH